ncbi:DUF7519 family protein [Haloparvum sedimenti]|uniref:DUF7519 family protein n=1 Tax=Haloparvum sedimenti TaxID=1678448 RepID=UPI00071E71BC|nr:hypothetical protein [Haloparvum sedimenti]
MTEIDRRPPMASVVAGTVFALLSVLACAAASAQGALVATVGLLALVVGLVRASRRALTWSVALYVAGFVVAGLSGADPAPLVAAAVALTLAWDAADHALSLGEHVGRDARSRRNQFVHAGTNALVGLLTGGVAYGTYVAATGGQPVAALVFLLLGAVAVVTAFR